jgi:ubiquinone/menaquinone biosynthesis C-methylase UbiE
MENDHKSSVIRYWNSVANRYLELFRNELQSKPFDLAQLSGFADSMGAGARVCDVGCGPCAHVTRLLADAGLDMVGIDLSPACIALARLEQPLLDLRVMDATALDFPTSSFDGLVAYYLVHYLPRHSWPELLAEFSRVLRSGGRLLVVMKSGKGEAWLPDPMGGAIETFWAACSAAELADVVGSAGFDIIETSTRGPHAAEFPVDRIYLHAACVKPADT